MASDDDILRVIKNMDRNFSAAVTMYQSISTNQLAMANNQAIQNKLILEMIEDMKAYRLEREKKETQNVTTKFDQLIASRFGFLVWFIDKVLPGVGLAVTLAILHKLGLL